MTWEFILKRANRQGLKYKQFKQAALNVTQNLERFVIDEIVEDLRNEYARLVLEDGLILTPAAAAQHAKNRLGNVRNLTAPIKAALRGVFTDRKSYKNNRYSTYFVREE